MRASPAGQHDVCARSARQDARYLHAPGRATPAAICARFHFGEYVTRHSSMRAARTRSFFVSPPTSCVYSTTSTLRQLVRWKSGWWPASSATSPARLRNAMASLKFFATKAREMCVPSAFSVHAGSAPSCARSAPGASIGVVEHPSTLHKARAADAEAMHEWYRTCRRAALTQSFEIIGVFKMQLPHFSVILSFFY
mgnify:CR=1 FL=1